MKSNYSNENYQADNMFNLTVTTETELFLNRKKEFEKIKNLSLEEIDSKKLYNDLLMVNKKINNRNSDVLNKFLSYSDKIVIEDSDSAFESGFKLGDEKPSKKVERSESKKANKVISDTKNAIKSSSNTTYKTQSKDLKAITSGIVASVLLLKKSRPKLKLYDVIDNVNANYDNVIGKTTKNKKNMSFSNYNTMITKEAVNQVYNAGSGKSQEIGREDDRVFVPAHSGSCPLCRPFENKYLVDDVNRAGRQPKGQKLIKLSYAIKQGFQHFNCRHTTIDAPPDFEMPKLNKDIDKTKYGDVSKIAQKQQYDLQLKQRQYERNIRKYKQRYESSISDSGKASSKLLISQNQKKIRDLKEYAESNNINFYRQPHREQIDFKFETFKPS